LSIIPVKKGVRLPVLESKLTEKGRISNYEGGKTIILTIINTITINNSSSKLTEIEYERSFARGARPRENTLVNDHAIIPRGRTPSIHFMTSSKIHDGLTAAAIMN
jgi:hypothetical protein